MRLSQLVEAPIPLSKKQSDDMARSNKNSDGAIVTALHRAKRACKSILLTQPALFRGASGFKEHASHIYYLPNEFALYEFTGRETPRNSATGKNMIQSLTRIHPEWQKMDFPARDLSVFCANHTDDASDFGQVGIVLPFDRVMKFGVTEDDLNLKIVHKNDHGAHHLLRFQNAISAFLSGLRDLLTDAKIALDNWNSDNQITVFKQLAKKENVPNAQFKKYLEALPLVAVVLKHEDWMETAQHSVKQWTPNDLKIIDELYDAWKECKDDEFIRHDMTMYSTDKMRMTFVDEKPSELFLHGMRPKTLGAEVTDYEHMLNSIRSTKLKEVWFQGPYFVLANHGDEDMSGERIKRWAESDSWMKNILTEVAG